MIIEALLLNPFPSAPSLERRSEMPNPDSQVAAFLEDTALIGIGGDRPRGILIAAASRLTIDQKLSTPTYQVFLYPVLDLLN